ncbi:PAS domain-containing hybrid sensor histidine kinase/response regulator [Pseudoalteromonas aurantia]|uniref:histidine kinase n=1 Tax=Pseudoalteromonas aurantia TaxID=43654 RepID=A0ABY2VXQ1_9GAMM|nr:ATP-binding protein [Pseudoalteromonas aurantia]TMO74548.1 hybrid sensor histidine kinase/response regulator [Pseudoalteromonas aurantia]
MDFEQEFVPLKKYRRAIAVTLSVAMLLAGILCLHLYHIKLERSYDDRVAHFQRLSGQLDRAMFAADSVFQSVFVSLDQPLTYHLDPFIMATLDQHANYYYRKLPHGAGEIIGQGIFLQSTHATRQWQQVMALGPAFNTALALIRSVDAVAYIKDNGFAFVKRRESNDSRLLTAILDGKLSPDFTKKAYNSSSKIEVNGQTYFSIGQRRSSTSNEHVVLIYNADKVEAWLNKVTLTDSEATLITKSHINLLSEKEFNLEPLNEMTLLAPWIGGVHLFSQKEARPIDLAFKQSERAFRNPILYEIGLELLFLTGFIIATFLAVTWLSGRIFIRPVSHFVRYLILQEHTPKTTFDYVIPVDWQPWFAQIKRVVMQKQALLEQLKQHNLVLDEQVRAQKKALACSLDVKERQASLLNTMLDNIPDLIYFKNIDGSFIGCNAAFETFLHVKREEIVGRELHEITDKFSELTALEQYMRLQQRSLTQTLVLDEKSYMLTLAPFYNEQHRLIGSFGVARDVTEQQQTMKSLQTSEENFKAAMEYAPNGVILASIDGGVLVLNKAAKRYLAAHTPAAGSQLSALFSEESYQSLVETFDCLLKHEQKMAELTLAQPGHYSWLQLSVSLVWDKQRQPKYFVIHLQNITQLTRAKLDAERATLAKSRFIANMSHEIRTPINVVLGLIDIIKKQGLSGSQMAYMSQVTYAAQQLLNMLNSILAFAKVESNQDSLVMKEFNLIDLFDDCSRLIKPLCDQKSLVLVSQIDSSVSPKRLGDINKLKLVLINLLNNAVKYSESGQITLSVTTVKEQEEEHLCFSVSDTGVGIKAQNQERLFDAFTQGDDSFSRKHEGIGLGLAIVKQEVALLGGEIKLHSQYGQGSKFYFSLPLSKAESNLGNVRVLWFGGSKPSIVLADVHVQCEPDIAHVITRLKEQDFDYLLCEVTPEPSIIDMLVSEEVMSLVQRIYMPNSSNSFIEHNENVVGVLQDGYIQRIRNDIEAQQQSPEKANDKLATIEGMLCLVIDDNELNLDITVNLLQQQSASVVKCNSAKDVVLLVRQLQPDVILMDVHMPELDGYTATRLLRREIPELPVSIVALTANEQAQEIDQALAHGMDNHLIKPVSRELLTQVLAQYSKSPVSFFDRTFALKQVMGKEDFLLTMLQKFAKLCIEYIQQLEEPQSAIDLALLAHSIKGAAAGLGFNRLAEDAKLLELHIKKTDGIKEQALVTNLKQKLKQTESYLAIECQGD